MRPVPVSSSVVKFLPREGLKRFIALLPPALRVCREIATPLRCLLDVFRGEDFGVFALGQGLF